MDPLPVRVHGWLGAAFAVLLIGAGGVQGAYAQAPLRILDIRKDPAGFDARAVRIEGLVTQYRDGASSDQRFYFLQGDYGGLIQVRTALARPAIGERRQVVGTVALDQTTKIPFIIEEERTEPDPPTAGRSATGPAAEAARVAPVAQRPEAASPGVIGAAPRPDPLLTYILIATLVIVLLLFSGVVIYLLQTTRPVPLAAGQAGLFPDTNPQAFRDAAVRVAPLPQETVRALPGRFRVLNGMDPLSDLRFFKTRANVNNEITFGRADGSPYDHIQLNSPTISRRQAKLVYNDDTYTLHNFSSSNPTTVNGRMLPVNQSVVLEDGDEIAMGEIVFRYHAG